MALNSGLTAAASVCIDFGTGGPAAGRHLRRRRQQRRVIGAATLGTIGGRAYNVDEFLGTKLNDTMTIDRAQRRARSPSMAAAAPTICLAAQASIR